jgi:hypothetical protein
MKKLGYKEIKPIGIKFYNTNTRGEVVIALDIKIDY